VSSELEQCIVWYTKVPHKIVEYVTVQALSVSHAEQQYWAVAPGNMFNTRIVGITLSKHADLYAYDSQAAVSVMDPKVPTDAGEITEAMYAQATNGLISKGEAEAIWKW